MRHNLTRVYTRRMVPGMSSNALRAHREEKGLTRDALAARSGVTSNTVYRIETGRHMSPLLETKEALASALDTDIHVLFPPGNGDD